MPKFKKAQYVKSAAAKGGYIKFYVWNVQKGELERKRHYIPSEYNTPAQKDAYAKDRIKQINTLLKEGYHIDNSKPEEIEAAAQKVNDTGISITGKTAQEPVEIRTAISALVKLREVTKHHERGIGFFEDTMLLFARWGEKQETPIIHVGGITYKIAQEYQVYILTQKDNSPKTHNNKLGVLITFVNECIKQNFLKGKNPIENFKMLPTDYGTTKKGL